MASQASQFQPPVVTKPSSSGLSIDTIRNMITSTTSSQLTEQDVKQMISQALDTYRSGVAIIKYNDSLKEVFSFVLVLKYSSFV